MNPANDGGPAFPCVERITRDGEFVGSGMTLRDYFAAAALTGLLANSNAVGTFMQAADASYKYADEMLAARGGAS